MLAILNSLNAHIFSISQPILMILVPNSWLTELFLIIHTYRVAVPLNILPIFVISIK